MFNDFKCNFHLCSIILRIVVIVWYDDVVEGDKVAVLDPQPVVAHDVGPVESLLKLTLELELLVVVEMPIDTRDETSLPMKNTNGAELEQKDIGRLEKLDS